MKVDKNIPSVLLSIQPKWCELIVSGKKTIEVRKTRPKLDTPFKCYIYMTQGKFKDLGNYSEWIYRNQQRVIGEFVCDRLIKFKVFEDGAVQFYMLAGLENSCLEYSEIADYIGGGKHGFAWHISDLVIYDKPREVGEFKTPCKIDADCCACPYYDYSIQDCVGRTVKKPPQSWCHVEELK